MCCISGLNETYIGEKKKFHLKSSDQKKAQQFLYGNWTYPSYSDYVILKKAEVRGCGWNLSNSNYFIKEVRQRWFLLQFTF